MAFSIKIELWKFYQDPIIPPSWWCENLKRIASLSLKILNSKIEQKSEGKKPTINAFFNDFFKNISIAFLIRTELWKFHQDPIITPKWWYKNLKGIASPPLKILNSKLEPKIRERKHQLSRNSLPVLEFNIFQKSKAILLKFF